MSRSIISGDRKRHCYICGRNCTTQVHHMIPGSYRGMSEKYGLTVNLCPQCHRELHDHSVHQWEMRQLAELEFIKRHPLTLWLQEFTKDYLVGPLGPFNFAGREE